MSNTIISNPSVENIKQSLIKDGIDSFHIVADFDRTLTPAQVNGEFTTTSFAKIRKGKVLSEEYETKADELFNHYHPIEISSDIPEENKNEMMREWWRLHLDLMREYGISKDIFSAIAENHQLQLRDGAAKLFKTLNTFKVPFVIMSAGLGDLIISLLQKETLLFDNVHVISNMFEWDQSGKAKGLANNVIHSSNKHEIELKNRPFYNDIAKRKNIILLGDSEGDIGMAAGLSPENILKIGFLNEEVDARLEMFEAIYDVVLLGDGDLSYVNDIVSSIVGT